MRVRGTFSGRRDQARALPARTSATAGASRWLLAKMAASSSRTAWRGRERNMAMDPLISIADRVYRTRLETSASRGCPIELSASYSYRL